MVALAGLLVFQASPASARAIESGPRHVIERATTGSLEADLSYLDTPGQQAFTYKGKTTTYTTHADSNFRVSIFRSGRVLFTQLLSCPHCAPGGTWHARPTKSVRWASLDPSDTNPEVLVDTTTGGAHCCLVTRFYLVDHDSVRVLLRDWGDLGYTLADLQHDGRTELVSADDRFAYEFASFGGSAFPIQIWALRNGVMSNVTRSYPSLVSADASKLWRLYLKERDAQPPDVRGVLAAWAADEALLGRWSEAMAALNLAKAKGYLDTDDAFTGAVKPSAGALGYLTQLRRFLVKTGYL
jgi:hypothetical protein